MKTNTKSEGEKMTLDDLAIILKGNFENIDKRFDGIETDIKGVKSQIRGIDSRIDDIAGSKVGKKEFEARLAPIEKKLAL